MEPLLVDIALLRALETPQLQLTPGRTVMARVVSQDESGRGEITIAGVKLGARLPAEVSEGDELRLTVKEVSADRVVLSLSQPAAALLASEAPVTLRHDDAEGEGEDSHDSSGSDETQVLALRYPAPALGLIDLRFELDEESMRISVALAPGTPFSSAHAAAGELTAAVADATHRVVSVSVSARRDPLDLYA